MQLANAMIKEGKTTFTENGAYALNTTGDHRLDLFGTIGSLRKADENRIITLFAEAYKQDPLFATKIAFYARDIREGLGERNTFRVLLKYMAEYHSKALRPNIDLIGVFGRYDDLYCLIGTPLEEDMWQCMKQQFEEDLRNLAEGKEISLLAKWIKTADSKVMADVSGSMYGRPLATAIGLATYFAERNKGSYQNMFMTFSAIPEIVILKGETFHQKINYINSANWDMNTDLASAFTQVLNIAIKNSVPKSEMVKSIIVVSDMQWSVDYNI